MSEIAFAALIGFFSGLLIGMVGVVFHATRARGYLANNGKRYKLTELS